VGIVPQVLGGQSLPLDLGRKQRLFSPAQRVALAHRDQGCAMPDCDRPPSWCEVHHAREPWAHGGSTDLEDGVLLCAFHHRMIHEDDWVITFETDDRRPAFIPPARLDPYRRRRTSTRYRPRRT
ncbi:MAG: HNH endonuclease signature motif containing protein, partial [Nocardioidaceae bacterium]|nr:HNH endonuclease signature motif containing protein [Nocardioidaceae bacterium]